MNAEVRNYIVNNLQPWRYPEEVKKALGKDATNPVPSSPYIEDYFKKSYNIKAASAETLFELELLGIYENLRQCLPHDYPALFEEHVAFGACYAQQPTAYVTRMKNPYAILWDFRLDDLLTQPTVLFSAAWRDEPMIDRAAADMLFNMCVAYNGLGLGNYNEPLLSVAIDRRWINHMQWGMSLYIIAHEMAHIILGHFLKAPLRSMRVLAKEGDINIGAFNRSKQQEFQADVVAIDLIVSGIDAGLLKGYTFCNESPFDALYQHVSWMFAIFACQEILRGHFDKKESDTHPPAFDRARVALGHLLNIRGDRITTNRRADEFANYYRNIASAVPLAIFEDNRFHEVFADFYHPEKYLSWIRRRKS